AVIAIFIMKFPNQTILFFRGIASMIQWLTYLLFFISVVGVFFPQYAYAPTSLVLNSILTAFKISIIVCGSLVLSDLILKQFKKQIHSLASILEINDFAMMGLILSCATSIAILPLYQKMDAKGKLLNAAFAVSGAYFLGGQLGYISNIVSSGSIVVVYLLTKIVCGILSIVVMSFVSSKKELSITDDNII
ncbi:MAG: ethanolamine utilization protein EutH, partial [Erysipelotrichaceae bacterium]|nr:ethanolamine utilization protein EutH [Erysipelotrichaceae bacterium]